MIFEDVTITKNDEIASGLWKMELNAPLISSMYKGAGQFIQIQLKTLLDISIAPPYEHCGMYER